MRKASSSRANKKATPRPSARRPRVDLDALLCALILAPDTFSRNRFFDLFQDPAANRVRRRARRVRSMIRQLTGEADQAAEIVGERVLEDGQVLLRYRTESLKLSRSTALSALEAAALRFSLSRAGKAKLSAEDRDAVRAACARLEKELDLPPTLSPFSRRKRPPPRPKPRPR